MSAEQLFPRANREFLTLLAGLPRHLDAAMPMRRQHRRELPGDIRHLSHLLTDERGDLRRDYLADPAALSAYMRYFLPWNIFRLGVLFSGLALDPGGDTPDHAATVIDLGTGPLTAPLALWMSRPRLRKRPLHFICVDRAPKPMRLGLDALHSLAGSLGGLAPWKITLVKGPLDARLREKADLIIMANALNEVLHRGEGEDLLETADALAWHLNSMLTPTGSLLVVEPGVRPSAHLMAALRRGFLHHGLLPLAPCPHTEPCPMSGRGYTAWCHFNFDADAAPGWLQKLSDEARLPKDNVSLGFLHFSAKGRKLETAPGKSFVRAVSGPFELPGDELSGAPRRFGQYACSDHGLTLLSLPKKHLVPLPGALIEAAWPDAPERDAKSGALILPLGGETPAPAMKAPAPAGAKGKATRPAPVAKAKAPRPARAEAAPKATTAGEAVSKAAPTIAPVLTVEGILAEGDSRPARKAPRLPSERPADQARGGRQSARKPRPKKSEGAAPTPAPKERDEEAAWPAEQQRPAKPAAKREGSTARKPAGEPKRKSAEQPGDKSGDRPDKLFTGQPSGQPADTSPNHAPTHPGDAPARRPSKKKPGKPAVKKGGTPAKKPGGKPAPKKNSRASRKGS